MLPSVLLHGRPAEQMIPTTTRKSIPTLYLRFGYHAQPDVEATPAETSSSVEKKAYLLERLSKTAVVMYFVLQRLTHNADF